MDGLGEMREGKKERKVSVICGLSDGIVPKGVLSLASVRNEGVEGYFGKRDRFHMHPKFKFQRSLYLNLKPRPLPLRKGWQQYSSAPLSVQRRRVCYS